MWLTKKKLKCLIGFHSTIKINNYNRGGEKGKKEKKNKSKRIYRTSHNTRKINKNPESLQSKSFPMLGITVHLTSLGCPPTLCWSLDLLWGSSDSYLVLLLSWSYSLPAMSTAVRASVLPLRVRSMAFSISHRHRVRLVDRVDFIYSLHRWRDGFGSP